MAAAGVVAEPAEEQDRPTNCMPRPPGAQSPALVPTARRRSPAGRSPRRRPARVPLAAARSGPASRSPFAAVQPRRSPDSSGLADARCWTRPRLTWPRCPPVPGSPTAQAAEDTQVQSAACAKAPAPGYTWKPALAAGGSPGSR